MFRLDPVEYLDKPSRQSYTGCEQMGYAPPNDDLLRVDLVVELVHCPVVFHVHRHLLCRFAVQHRERRAYVHFSIIRARPKEGTNDAVLCICPAKIVVQDREEGDWMDGNGGRSATVQIAWCKLTCIRGA